MKIIVLLFFACFFYLININNYVKVYRLMSLNDDFDVKGVVYNQKDNNLFVLNSINYQGKGEKYLYDYSYIIEYDNHIIYESKKMHAKIPEKDEDVYKLSEVVENIQLYEPIEYVKNKNLYIKILYKNTDYYLENIMICIEIVKF